ncbi:MAG: hypothetical protein KBC69_03445 [Candidatus Magasanikbacteria bacterium]|nr:hypothetical protein [Candidatus Magasanikbacteria bacterium]
MGYDKLQDSGTASDDAADTTRDTSHRAGAGGSARRRSSSAPGKRTLTQGLPPRKQPVTASSREVTMTGDGYVDAVDPCGPNGSQGDTDECSLDAEQAANLTDKIILQLGLLGQRVHAAFVRIRIGRILEKMHRQRLLDGFADMMFLGSMAFFKPVVASWAKALESEAWHIATVAPRTAGVIVDVASGMEQVVAIGGQVLRTKLRDVRLPNGEHPENSQVYLDVLEGGVSDMISVMFDSIGGKTHNWKRAFLEAIQDKQTTSIEAFVSNVQWLLEQFEACRLGEVQKDLQFGEDMGQYRIVEFKPGERMVVLLEGYVARRSQLELNGAPEGTTPETLRFIRFVPAAMHKMAIAEMEAKRGKESVSHVIKFYGADNESASTPWRGDAGDAWVKLKHSRDEELADFVDDSQKKEDQKKKDQKEREKMMRGMFVIPGLEGNEREDES